MKNLIFIIVLSFSLISFADYSKHKDSQKVIDELVNEHGFEEAYANKLEK